MAYLCSARTRQASSQCLNRRVVFLYTLMAIPFNKQYESPTYLAQLLQSRGLQMDSLSKAETCLKRYGYYRLSAYWHPLLQMPKTAHVFKPGASLDQTLMLYSFDAQLRLFIFKEISKIEIAVRSAIVNIISRETGDMFWMTNSSWFMDQPRFSRSMVLIQNEYDRSSEDFVQHFKQTYSDPFPPAWILAEILPLGTLTNIFRNFRVARIKKLVAKEFDLSLPVFDSWMNIIAVTRNSCGHHSRVWNKVFSFNARLESNMIHPWISNRVQQGRIFFTLCIIKYFVDLIDPENDMLTRLRWLFVDYPQIDKHAMGFPDNWELEPLWR